MNSMIHLSFVCTLLLLLGCVKVDSHPTSLDYDYGWETGHHPFPEMSRFLNSHSRVHQPSTRPSYSFLGYLCGIADDNEKLAEMLVTFGKKYRSLITTIIKKDCSKYDQQQKRTILNNQRKHFPRIFLRNRLDSSLNM